MAYMCEIVSCNEYKKIDFKKVDELTRKIIDIFKEEKLTYGEAKCVLKQTSELLSDCSIVNALPKISL